MISYEELTKTWDEMVQAMDAQRRVIVCPRVQVVVIQSLIDAHGVGGLFRVLGNDIVKDRVLVIDPNVHTEYLELWT
jgi:hypothetical protein